MKIKRIVIFTMVVCLLSVTPVGASMKTHWIKRTGEFSCSMSSKRTFKESVKYSNLSKKKKKEALKLFKKNPRALYKKYRKKLNLSDVFKTKLKKNTFTVWGIFRYKGNGIKKKYKFGKYKFKLSSSTVLKYSYQAYIGPMTNTYKRGSKMRKELKDPYGIGYTLKVSKGKIYYISSLS